MTNEIRRKILNISTLRSLVEGESRLLSRNLYIIIMDGKTRALGLIDYMANTPFKEGTNEIL
jgi:hypothetical protein